MEFQDVLTKRNSTRDFTDQEVSDDLIKTLLADALKAPSSSNTQSYRVAIAKGATKDKIAEALLKKYDKGIEIQRLKGVSKIVRGITSGALPNGDFKPDIHYPSEQKRRAIECGKGLYGVLGIERHDRAARDAWMRKNFEFFNASVAMFIFVHGERAEYSALDTGMFLQNLMLSATDKGLGTCAQASVAMWGGDVRPFFSIEDKYKLICGVCLGYPSNDKINSFQPEKRTVEEICFPVA
ncbi:hypothetical protein A3762_14080 [Oleiphilus sp. HI0125]|uniref:nitroreductase n=1 Tax=Oleiphilus sp. HI0125 TaxID=1822266 RepID=UPI0007C305B6|nr:nitroreductase [Oleiphilus sp. HI0125]KZZ61637.1 hypothetical protein A3762_14080 [Oleiphilus sp. HI0125]